MDDFTFEKNFWGNCVNTFEEETKQFVYAKFMGIEFDSMFRINMHGKSVVDIGGGPCSLLLKTTNLSCGSVVDPLRFPEWVYQRYTIAGINFSLIKGEEADFAKHDECWIYNCLQHVDDPRRVIENAKKIAPVLRIFEWINFPAYDGHPHALTQTLLEDFIGQKGNSVRLTGPHCVGDCFYGVFSFS
jgi:hypothetical protein